MPTLNIILSALSIAITGFVKAYLDKSAEGKFRKAWWNKGSFLNKWKLENGMRIANPRRGIFQPEWVEAFPGSSTYRVWQTDGWHLLQMLYHISQSLAFAMLFLPSWWTVVVFFGSWVLLTTSFALTRRFVLKDRT